MRRVNFTNVLEAMAYLHSTSDSESSSNKDDLNFLLVDLAFGPQRVLVAKSNMKKSRNNVASS